MDNEEHVDDIGNKEAHKETFVDDKNFPTDTGANAPDETTEDLEHIRSFIKNNHPGWFQYLYEGYCSLLPDAPENSGTKGEGHPTVEDFLLERAKRVGWTTVKKEMAHLTRKAEEVRRVTFSPSPPSTDHGDNRIMKPQANATPGGPRFQDPMGPNTQDNKASGR